MPIEISAKTPNLNTQGWTPVLPADADIPDGAHGATEPSLSQAGLLTWRHFQLEASQRVEGA